jgi:hypothetical protein
MRRALLIVLLLWPTRAFALGPLELLGEGRAREARLDTGVQTGVVGWLGYGQRLPRLLWDRELAFEVRVGMPLVSPDLGDSGLEAGAQIDVMGWGSWRLRNQLDLALRTTENLVYDGVELALRDTVSFGWQAARGGFGLDLGWEQGLSTHIAHSDWYRTNIYPEAEDGWIAFPSGRVRMGLYGDVVVGAGVVLAARLGLDWDRTGRPDYLPLVALFTAAYRF